MCKDNDKNGDKTERASAETASQNEGGKHGKNWKSAEDTAYYCRRRFSLVMSGPWSRDLFSKAIFSLLGIFHLGYAKGRGDELKEEKKKTESL